jgi:hypothetical protein
MSVSVYISYPWYERWNIKIIDDKIHAIYFSCRRVPVEAHLTLKGRNVPFVKDMQVMWGRAQERLWHPYLYFSRRG